MSLDMASATDNSNVDPQIQEQQPSPVAAPAAEPVDNEPFMPVTPANHGAYTMTAMSAPAGSQSSFQAMQQNAFYAPHQSTSPPVNVVPQKRGKEAVYRFHQLTPTGNSQHPESVKRRKTIAKKVGLDAAKFTIRETARSRRRHRKAAAAKKPDWQFLSQIQRDEILKQIDETIQAEIATSDRLAEEHWNKVQHEQKGEDQHIPQDGDAIVNHGQEQQQTPQQPQQPQQQNGDENHDPNVTDATANNNDMSPNIGDASQMDMIQLPDFQQSPMMTQQQISEITMTHFQPSDGSNAFDQSPSVGANVNFSADVDVTPQKRGQKAVIRFDPLTPSGRSKHPAAFKRRRILSQKSGLEAAKFTIRETARSRKRNRKAALMRSAEWQTMSDDDKEKKMKEIEERIQLEIATSDRQAEREFAARNNQAGGAGNQQGMQQLQQQQPFQQQQQTGDGSENQIIMNDNQQMIQGDGMGMNVIAPEFQYMHNMGGVADQQQTPSTLKVREYNPKAKRGSRSAKQKQPEEDMSAAFLDPQLQAEDIRMRGNAADSTDLSMVDPSLTAETGTVPTEGQAGMEQQQQALEPVPVNQAADTMEVVGADESAAPPVEPVEVEQNATVEGTTQEAAAVAAAQETSPSKARGRPAKRGRGRQPKKNQPTDIHSSEADHPHEGVEEATQDEQQQQHDNQPIDVVTAGAAELADNVQQLISAAFPADQHGAFDLEGQAGMEAFKASIDAAMQDFNSLSKEVFAEDVNQHMNAHQQAQAQAAQQAQQQEQEQQQQGQQAASDASEAAEQAAAALNAAAANQEDDVMQLSHEVEAEPEDEAEATEAPEAAEAAEATETVETTEAAEAAANVNTTSPARGRGRPARGRGRGRGRKRGGFAGRGNKATETHKDVQDDEEEAHNNDEATAEEEAEAADTVAAPAGGDAADPEATSAIVETDSPVGKRRSGRVGRKASGAAEDLEATTTAAAPVSPNTRRRSSRHTRNPSQEIPAGVKGSPEAVRGTRRTRRQAAEEDEEMEDAPEGADGERGAGWSLGGFRSIFKKMF